LSQESTAAMLAEDTHVQALYSFEAACTTELESEVAV